MSAHTLDPSDPTPVPVRFRDHHAGAVPGSANGGLVAGTLAGCIEGSAGVAVKVRLHLPIPLGRGLVVERTDAEATLRDDVEVVATARTSEAELAPRGPVAPHLAARPRRVVPVVGHPAPRCFVCGPANDRGLDLQPGAIDGHDLVATLWRPPVELADADGHLSGPIVWAALDCPSWYGAAAGVPALLGTITACRYRPVPVTRPVIVSGWHVDREGRKTMAGSAIHAADGELLAAAASTWIHPKEHDDA